MTAVWMVYALVSGVVFGAIAWLLEQLARAFGRPTRGIWIVAMGAMLSVGVVAVNPTVVALPPTSDWRAVAVPSRVRVFADRLEVRPPPAGQAPLNLPGRPINELAALDARLARVIAVAAPWDRFLLFAWAIVTAFVAGILAHAATVGRRLRTGLDTREIDGTPVLVTGEIGPVAIGVRRKAILMPRWTLSLEPALLRLVVRHEREHLSAGDPTTLMCALLAIVLVPWQLPLWWAWRRLSLAVEVDCDARVLRSEPDVLRYGQLLLLACQRATQTPWASSPVFAVVAPLRPQQSHVAQRILAMTNRNEPVRYSRIALLTAGSAIAAAAAFALPAPRAHLPPRAIVHLTSLGLVDTPVDPTRNELKGEILLYGDGPVRVATGIDTLVPLKDTLHLKRLPAITADVTDGALHIVLVGPGTFSVGGGVTGGLAPGSMFGASGRHITLTKGGTGIRGVR